MPLFWISLAFLCGILLAANLSIPLSGWIISTLLALLLLLPPIMRHWSRYLSPALSKLNQRLKIPSPAFYPICLVFISLGAIRYQTSQPIINPSFIAYYNGNPGEFTLEGVLVEPPDVRETYTNLHVRIENIHPVNESRSIPVEGEVLAIVSKDSTMQYGDRVRLQAKIETPPENEDFSYRSYLARQSIYSYLPSAEVSLLQHNQGNPIRSVLYTLRSKASDVIYRLFPDPEASLLCGILLGVETGIPEQVQEAFRLTGTSHIIVISGFNITIIAGLFTFLFSRILGRRNGAIAAALGIIFYTLLVGANAAVLRAAFLGMLTLLGHQLGRQQV